jgi:hypothetical protein
VERQPPSVDKGADAESGRCGRLLPLTGSMRVLCPISVAVRVAGVVAALACVVDVRMAVPLMTVCMTMPLLSVCIPILRLTVLRPLSSLQADHEV